MNQSNTSSSRKSFLPKNRFCSHICIVFALTFTLITIQIPIDCSFCANDWYAIVRLVEYLINYLQIESLNCVASNLVLNIVLTKQLSDFILLKYIFMEIY